MLTKVLSKQTVFRGYECEFICKHIRPTLSLSHFQTWVCCAVDGMYVWLTSS
jgi:hypothetical protein